MFRKFSAFAITISIALLVLAPAVQALDFAITYNGSWSPQAISSFENAATQWEQYFVDPTTIYIDAYMANLGNPEYLGSTNTTTMKWNYDSLVNSLKAGEPSTSVVQFLPTSSQFTANYPYSFTLDKSSLWASTANLKALGLITPTSPGYTNFDATIIFNTSISVLGTPFSWDFNNNDGMSPNTIDFETVAAHELGHALGFISIVDTLDENANAGIFGSFSPFVLDLFRFPDAGPATPEQFRTSPRELRYGEAADFNDLTFQYSMATGALLGDGYQASHWKEDSLLGRRLGIMDPAVNLAFYGDWPFMYMSSEYYDVALADIMALNYIGYDYVGDVVPLPGSFWLLGSALLGLMGYRWRRFKTRLIGMVFQDA